MSEFILKKKFFYKIKIYIPNNFLHVFQQKLMSNMTLNFDDGLEDEVLKLRNYI